MPPEIVSLWRRTEAAGALAERFLCDSTTTFYLDALARGTTLGAAREKFAGQNVVLRTGAQLATALALLELDGIAARIVLCTPDLSQEHLRGAIATTEATLLVSDEKLPDLTGIGLTQIECFGPAIVGPCADRAGICETEWALFTSGTTGAPKIVIHRLDNLTASIGQAGTASRNDVWSTFYDIRRYGGLQILLRALIGGGSMVLSSATEAAGDFLARGAAAGVTFLSGTPTHWRRALLSPAAASIAPRNVRLSGEVADQAILDKLRAAYKQSRVCHAFASTEAGVAFEVDDGLAGFPASWIGQTREGVELRVMGGTLWIRSARTADRFLGDDTGPLKDADGFVDTKDIVVLQDGRYHFFGRADGVINVGGLKVHPEEVETVVNRHPRVQMSLVRAKRSPIIGSVVTVDVVLYADPGNAGGTDFRALESEIISSCRQAMAAYKVPAAVRVVPALQISAAGKLIRPNSNA
jgi:acyl-CoA synthetase (AMP-forming)/AMP-acid ligase II